MIPCINPMSHTSVEMCAIVEWAGLVSNSRTGKPSEEEVRRGVEEVLRNGKYRDVCTRSQEEIRVFDPLGVVKRAVEVVVFESRW